MTGVPRRTMLGTVALHLAGDDPRTPDKPSEALPAHVIAELKAMDPAITPELAQATWALLTPFHEKTGYTAPRIARDLTYGDDPRHRLDVHTDAEPAAGAPVLLFVHG